MAKTKLAEKIIKKKGPQEGTRAWLKHQLATAPSEEPTEEENEAKRQLLRKLRGRGQGEHVEGNALASL